MFLSVELRFEYENTEDERAADRLRAYLDGVVEYQKLRASIGVGDLEACGYREPRLAEYRLTHRRSEGPHQGSLEE